MNINKAIVCGRITKELTLKVLPSGNNVLQFSLATNYHYKDKDGNKQERGIFHNIVAFGKLAETISTWSKKGDELYIEGRIDNRSYDKDDGSKGYISEIIVENFQFGQKAKSNQNSADEYNGYDYETQSKPTSKSNTKNVNVGGLTQDDLDYGDPEDCQPDYIPFN